MEKFCYVDFETDNTAGLGLLYYRKDFRVTSASFLVDGKCLFSTSFDEIRDTLAYFIEDGYTIVAYNIAFDCAIIKHVFGHQNIFSQSLDAWRLACYCNLYVGEKGNTKKQRKTSLPAMVEYLFGIEDYKRPYLDKIIEMGLAKTDKEAHAHIGELPEDMLEAYNNLDTFYCKSVLDECLKRLDSWGVDWKPDYECFSREVELYSDAFVRGIKVDRELMSKNIETLTQKIEEAKSAILALPEIAEIERMMNKTVKVTKATVAAWKKAHGIEKSYQLSEEEILQVEEWQRAKKWIAFNFNSTLHKKRLFLDVLKMPVVKLTKKASPAMSKAAMKCYGDIGKLFINHQNLSKQLEECGKLYEMSAYDGRLHPSLRSGSTLSGRSSSKSST